MIEDDFDDYYPDKYYPNDYYPDNYYPDNYYSNNNPKIAESSGTLTETFNSSATTKPS
ncbi:11117_t:CDS:2 [Gigaspora margarita]|uniref:11117_t:CDS:1 n=1 Tax=Gigaspora margarita TaxID=4874 RepID=A0ABM8VZG5_GIGMA|nr:11117_t:CDS:2 [Gigaspora margarita]